MPRYYFDLQVGEPIEDDEGALLADLESARQCAVRTLTQLVGPERSTFWEGQGWSVTLRDESGPVLTLRISAEVVDRKA